jgi:hypothetical protein
MENETLTVEEAYKAMFNYLENLYFQTKSDDLGGFLGSMSLLPDGKPADPAIWEDWLKSVSKSKSGLNINLF